MDETIDSKKQEESTQMTEKAAEREKAFSNKFLLLGNK